MGPTVRTALIACVVAVALGAAAPAQAQRVGLAAGATMSEINASGDERLNVLLTDKLEPTGGIVLEMDAAASLSIRLEALYAVKGTRFETAGARTDVDLKYLEVPLLLRYTPGPDSPVRWLRLFGGGYAARLLDARVVPARAPVRDLAMKDWDAGWVAGIGAAAGHVSIDFRYLGGVLDLAPDLREVGPAPSVKFRNRGFALLAAYVF
jgi:hypothetical protein